MNAPFVVAQANTSGSTRGSTSVRTIKVLKPQGDQAVTVQLGYDQNYKLDLSAIANERITLVHIGEKLIILFDNKSTVTVEPFFDSMNAPLSNVTVEAAGRDFSSSDFASAFPITTDQSILTAAGAAGAAGSPASGADFHGPSVDPLDQPNPLPLLGPEELPNWTITQQLGVAPVEVPPPPPESPPIENPPIENVPNFAGNLSGVVEEEELNPERNIQFSDSGFGNEDENSASGDDHDILPGTPLATSLTATGSLAGLVTGGDLPLTFLIDSAANGTTVKDTGGNDVTSFGVTVEYVFISSTQIEGWAFPSEAPARFIFTLTVNTDGAFTFTLNDQIDHPDHTVDVGSTSNGSLEETLGLDLTALVGGHDNTGHAIILPNPNMFTVGVIDDTPVAHINSFEEGGLAVDETVPSGDENGGIDPFSSYGTPLGVATQFVVSSAGSNPGADGLGSSTHIALEIVGGDGADSGLTTTGGTAIHLFLNGGIVEGRVDGSGDVAFALSISDFGQMTVAQYLSLHHPDSSNPNDSVDLSGMVNAVVTVTDGDGDVATSSIDVGGAVSFFDDGPAANADTDSVFEGADATGNVLTGADTTSGVAGADTAGADGYGASAVVGVAAGSNTSSPVSGGVGTTIETSLGFLTLLANGNYTYAAKPNATDANAFDTFVYTIVDGDGDLSTTTLTINVSNVTVTATDTDALVNEAGLPVIGSDAASNSEIFTTGAITPAGGTGPYSYALTSSANGAYGNLVLNTTTGAYTYTLDTAYDGATANNGITTEQDKDSFGYTVTDANGNTVTGTILVDIIDDVPTARADTDSVTEGADATGNVLTGADTTSGVAGADTAGADGFGASAVVGVAAGSNTSLPVSGGVGGAGIPGLYGTLILNADGSYTYAANPNAVTSNQPDTFVYTIVDGDGDLSTTTLTINVANVTVTASDTDALVNEAGLPTGSDAASNSEIFNGTITPAGGTGPYSYALTSSANGAYGNLVLNANGTYTYTLDTAYDGATANNGITTEQDRDSFGYTVTDANGNTVTGTILVDIVDDVPNAVGDIATVSEGGQQGSSDVVLIIDRSGSMQGTLIQQVKDAVQALFESGTVHSVFLVSFSSAATFHSSGVNGGWYTDLTAALAAVDGLSANGSTDYDAALQAVTLNFTAPPPGGDQLVSMFLSDGVPTDDNGTGTLGIDQDDTGVGGIGEEAAWINFLTTNGFDASYAFGFGGIDATDIAFLEPIAWTGPGETADSPYDADNATASNDPNVIIVADPNDLGDVLIGTIGTPVTGNIIDGGLNDTFGADGGRILSITVNTPGPGTTTYTWDGDNTITPSSGSAFSGKSFTVGTELGGTFTFYFATVGINSAGTWTYTSPANVAVESHDLFPYVIVDNDGDTSSATLDITVTNVNAAPTSTNDSVTTNEDTAIVLGLGDFGTYSDPESTPIAAVQISTLESNGSLEYDTTGGGTWTAVALNQVVTAVDIAANRLRLVPDSNENGTPYATIGFKVGDGTAFSASANTLTVNVTALNDAPTANITSLTFNATEQTNLNLAQGGLSLGSIADIDAGSNVISATLSVTAGILTVTAGNSGIDSVSGSGTSSVTVTGTVTEINNLLGGVDTGGGSAGTIVYQANTDTPPAIATLTLLVDDTGDTGSGGPLTGTDTATINIAAVNDAPVATDDIVITNVSGSGSTFLIPEWALLSNDTDPDSTLDITATSSVNDLTSASLATNPGSVTVTNNDTDGGSFNYTASDGSLTDTGAVTVNVDTGTMNGGNGAEIFIGDSNGTTINASGGNDILIANGGNDTLNGGAGKDYMVGGSGADTFDFNATSESGNTIATADVIADFVHATDFIDVSGIDAVPGGGDNAFLYGGNNVNTVANSITWFESGGNTIVQLDTNGAAGAEMMFVLTGVSLGLTTADFVK